MVVTEATETLRNGDSNYLNKMAINLCVHKCAYCSTFRDDGRTY